MSESSSEPKLIIDEDYKERVARERQEAALREAEEQASKGDADSASGVSVEDDELSSAPPEATLSSLVSMLATQAIMSTGQALLPGQSEPPPADLPAAKFYIDLLGMLEEKTASHRTAEESELLRESLHQLRLLYVQSLS
jgi:hypothetical protein